MDFVTCATCKNSIRDSVGDGNGIMTCRVMESWLDKFPRRRPKPDVYDANFARLGGKVYWPDVQRACEKFERV